MNAEFEKISNAIDRLSSLTEALRNTKIDPEPYWERARKAREKCAQPTRDALLVVMSNISCALMYQPDIQKENTAAWEAGKRAAAAEKAKQDA